MDDVLKHELFDTSACIAVHSKETFQWDEEWFIRVWRAACAVMEVPLDGAQTQEAKTGQEPRGRGQCGKSESIVAARGNKRAIVRERQAAELCTVV